MKKVVEEFIKRRSQRLDSKRNDADKWITAHPNGEESTGVRIKINEQGEPTGGWAKKKGLNFSGAKSVPLSELKKEKTSGNSSMGIVPQGEIKPIFELNPKKQVHTVEPIYEPKIKIPDGWNGPYKGSGVSGSGSAAMQKIEENPDKEVRLKTPDGEMTVYRDGDNYTVWTDGRKEFNGKDSRGQVRDYLYDIVTGSHGESPYSRKATRGSVDLSGSSARGILSQIQKTMDSMSAGEEKNFFLGGSKPDVTIAKGKDGYTVYTQGAVFFKGENAKASVGKMLEKKSAEPYEEEGSKPAKKNSNPKPESVDLTSKNVRGAIDSVVESIQSMGKRGKKNFHIGEGRPDVTVSKAGGGFTVFDNTNGENTGEHTFYGENAIEDVRHYFHDILVKKSKNN